MHSVPRSAPPLGRGEGNIKARRRIKNDEQSLSPGKTLDQPNFKIFKVKSKHMEVIYKTRATHTWSQKVQKLTRRPWNPSRVHNSGYQRSSLTKSDHPHVIYKARTSWIRSQKSKNMCTGAWTSVVSTSLHIYKAPFSNLSTWSILKWLEEQDGQVKFCKKGLKLSVVSTPNRVHETKKAKKEAIWAHFKQGRARRAEQEHPPSKELVRVRPRDRLSIRPPSPFTR